MKKERERLLKSLKEVDVNSDEYSNILERLSKLEDILNKNKVKKDTLYLVGANLLGIVMILTFEKANILGSKALTQIMKLKV